MMFDRTGINNEPRVDKEATDCWDLPDYMFDNNRQIDNVILEFSRSKINMACEILRLRKETNNGT